MGELMHGFVWAHYARDVSTEQSGFVVATTEPPVIVSIDCKQTLVDE